MGLNEAPPGNVTSPQRDVQHRDRPSLMRRGSNDSVTRAPLLDLYPELHAEVAHFLLATDPLSAIRYAATCRKLRVMLSHQIKQQAESKRLQWNADDSMGFELFEHDRACRRVPAAAYPWAVSSLLPQAGQSSWLIRVRENGEGLASVGVCDADARCAWALDISVGSTTRMNLDAKGELKHGAAPPSGYPSGRGGVTVARKADDQDKDLQPTAEVEGGKYSGKQDIGVVPCPPHAEDGCGVVIQVRVDHEAGSVGFLRRGEEGQEVVILGFPKGAPLRPWASCCYLGDEVSFVTPFVQTSGTGA